MLVCTNICILAGLWVLAQEFLILRQYTVLNYNILLGLMCQLWLSTNWNRNVNKHGFLLKDTAPCMREHIQLLLRIPQDNIICQAVLHRETRLLWGWYNFPAREQERKNVSNNLAEGQRRQLYKKKHFMNWFFIIKQLYNVSVHKYKYIL